MKTFEQYWRENTTDPHVEDSIKGFHRITWEVCEKEHIGTIKDLKELICKLIESGRECSDDWKRPEGDKWEDLVEKARWVDEEVKKLVKE